VSSKKYIINYLRDHVGEIVDRGTLQKVSGVYDWQRTIRSLRSDDGWDIDTLKDGYRLNSLEQKQTETKREAINDKLRYAILQRDQSTCQRCGRTIKDGVKLHIDHKVPVDMGGRSIPENLWVLCDTCNLGKKNFFSDEDASTMRQILALTSGRQRLIKYFKLNPNKIIDPLKLQIISDIRDWTRTIRDIRIKENMNIVWVEQCDKYPSGGYMYKV
jgi:5-methylcytosine-specific restriction endonuclease McrA